MWYRQTCARDVTNVPRLSSSSMVVLLSEDSLIPSFFFTIKLRPSGDYAEQHSCRVWSSSSCRHVEYNSRKFGAVAVEMWSSQRGDVEQPTWRCGAANVEMWRSQSAVGGRRRCKTEKQKHNTWINGLGTTYEQLIYDRPWMLRSRTKKISSRRY